MFNRKTFRERWETGEAKLKANCWRDVHGVTLYSTRIVDWSERGVIRLYTGGYRTVSTKTHMNEVLKLMYTSAYVFQKNGEWFISVNDGVFPFAEGVELRAQA